MFYGSFIKCFLKLRDIFFKNDEYRLAHEIYPENVKTEVFTYLEDGNEYHKFNLYKLINDKKERPLIIDIHGGAWVYGDKDLKKAFCTSFVERGYDVISLSYRLVNDVLIKDIVKDIFDCLNYIDENKDKLGVSFKNVFITGDSAGGHLALVVSKILNDKALADELGLKLPSFEVKASLLNHPVPFTTVAGILPGRKITSKLVSVPGVKRALYGKNYKKDIWFQKLADPYVYINKDDKLPKFIVVTSENDHLYYYQSVMLKELFEKEEIDFEFSSTKDKDACHVYNSILPYTEIGIEANNKIDNYFKKHMKNG